MPFIPRRAKKAAPANQNKLAAPARDSAQTFLFDEGAAVSATSSLPNFGQYLTFRNIVLALGLGTLLLFIGSAVSPRVAFVFAALIGLAGLVMYDMAARRRWQGEMAGQLHRMSGDYERLVREVARHRNEVTMLKKTLAEAGSMARSYSRTADDSVENRMLRAIALQLAKIGENEREESAIDFSAFNTAALEKDAPLTAADPDKVGSTLTDEQVLQLLDLAVRSDRVDLFLQPVVSLPQRKLRFYEALSRIRIKPDVYLPAERYVQLARQRDLLPLIDNLLLLRSLQVLRDTQHDDTNRAFFCNITSATLNDPKFMGDLVEFIAQNRALAPRIVFEMGQQELAAMGPDLLPVLGGLANLGCRFSMDQVKRLSFDYAQLEARCIRFIKVDASLLLGYLREENGLRRLRMLKTELDRQGIDLIAEKVETERQLIELLDVEIDYGQGYLFGRPQSEAETTQAA